MNRQENRIIIAGLVLGAAAGGIVVMLLRMRDARRNGISPEPLSDVLRELSWQEVFGIAVAALALARRIAGLPPELDEKRKS